MPRKTATRPSTRSSTRKLGLMHSDRHLTADSVATITVADQQSQSQSQSQSSTPSVIYSPQTKHSTTPVLSVDGSNSMQTPPPPSHVNAGIDEGNGPRRSARKRKATVRSIEIDEASNLMRSTKRRRLSSSRATPVSLDLNTPDEQVKLEIHSHDRPSHTPPVVVDTETPMPSIQVSRTPRRLSAAACSESPGPSRRSKRIASRVEDLEPRKRLHQITDSRTELSDRQSRTPHQASSEASSDNATKIIDASLAESGNPNTEAEPALLVAIQDDSPEVLSAQQDVADTSDKNFKQEEMSSDIQQNLCSQPHQNKLIFHGADVKTATAAEQAYASDTGSKRGGKGNGRGGGRGGNWRGRGGRGRGGAAAGRGRGGDSPERPIKQILSAEARARIAHLKQRQGELRRFFAILGGQQTELLDVLAARDIESLARKAKAHKKVPEYQEVSDDLIAARDHRQTLIRRQYEMAKDLAMQEFDAGKELIEQRWRTHVENVQKEHIRGAAGDIALLQRAYLGSGDEARTEDGSEVGFFPQYHEMPESDATVRGYHSGRVFDEKSLRQGLPTVDELAARDVIDDEVTRPNAEALAKKRAVELEEISRQHEEHRAEEAREKTQTLDALAEFASSEEIQKQLAEMNGHLNPRPVRGGEVDTYALSELADIAEWAAQQHPHQQYIYHHPPPPPEGVSAFPREALNHDPVPGRHYTLPPPPPPPPMPQYKHWQPPLPPQSQQQHTMSAFQQRPPSAYDPTLIPPPSSSPSQFRPLAAKAPLNGLPPPGSLPPPSSLNSASARRSLRSIAPQPLNQGPPQLLHHGPPMSLPPPPPSPVSLAPGGSRPLPPLPLPPKQPQPPLIPPQRKQYTFVPLQQPPTSARFSPIQSPAHSRSPSTSGFPGMPGGPNHPSLGVGGPNTSAPATGLGVGATVGVGTVSGPGAGTAAGRGGTTGRGGRGSHRGVKAGQGKIPMQFVNSTVDGNGRRALLPKP